MAVILVAVMVLEERLGSHGVSRLLNCVTHTKKE